MASTTQYTAAPMPLSGYSPVQRTLVKPVNCARSFTIPDNTEKRNRSFAPRAVQDGRILDTGTTAMDPEISGVVARTRNAVCSVAGSSLKGAAIGGALGLVPTGALWLFVNPGQKLKHAVFSLADRLTVSSVPLLKRVTPLEAALATAREYVKGSVQHLPLKLNLAIMATATVGLGLLGLLIGGVREFRKQSAAWKRDMMNLAAMEMTAP